jgi:succinate dehydrogenase / fumarate reductase cytochrome b subunit
LALQSGIVMLLYTIGVLSCVFHLANGIWTMGITWGVWISPRAQKQALRVCGVFGVLLAIVGMSALFGMWSTGRGEKLQEARSVEDKIYDSKVNLGEIEPTPEKRAVPAVAGEASLADANKPVSIQTSASEEEGAPAADVSAADVSAADVSAADVSAAGASAGRDSSASTAGTIPPTEIGEAGSE